MDKKEVLVLGRGFLGRTFERNGYRVYGRDEFSAHGENSVIDLFSKLSNVSCIVNCIGNADTRGCELGPNWDDVFFVNALLPKYLSKYSEAYGIKFVHISTGCVYDQNSRPNVESASVSSHCNYVVSKICAENFCNLEKDLIIRPRLFFGEEEDKNNLLCKLPKFDYHLNELNSFTSTQTIVEATESLINNSQYGVFNVAQEGYATIKEICGWVGLKPKPPITGLELQKDQSLSLVNNTLDISKLKFFHTPRNLKDEIINNWKVLTN